MTLKPSESESRHVVFFENQYFFQNHVIVDTLGLLLTFLPNFSNLLHLLPSLSHLSLLLPSLNLNLPLCMKGEHSKEMWYLGPLTMILLPHLIRVLLLLFGSALDIRDYLIVMVLLTPLCLLLSHLSIFLTHILKQCNMNVGNKL